MQPYLNRRTLAIVAVAAIILAVGIALFYAARSRQADNDRPPSRFVSVKADKANVRAGPGKRYPVRWVFVQPGIPVEILAEYENWRQIRDWEGQEGWMHAAMLSRKRSVIVTGEKRTLYRRADAASPPVVTLKPGIVAEIEDCNEEWCRVEVRNNRGWLRRGEFWGIEPGEVIE
ncbi:MAG: SH3 domain-containing protein [Proteobacteria bacterium]|nr:SH3 domain-containing protein [Pseudomonadota bacterium]